jgi:hypothetical protein
MIQPDHWRCTNQAPCSTCRDAVQGQTLGDD